MLKLRLLTSSILTVGVLLAASVASASPPAAPGVHGLPGGLPAGLFMCLLGAGLVLALLTHARGAASPDAKWGQGLAREALDTAGALIVVLDAEGRVLFFNRACQELTGLSLDDLRDKPVWETVVPACDRELVRGVFMDLLSGHSPNRAENYWIGAGGHDRLITWSNTVLPDKDTQSQYVVCTGIDVTEHRRDQEALTRSEAKFRTLYDSTSDAVMLLNKHAFVDCNRAAQALFGCASREELCSKHPADLSPAQQPCGGDSRALADEHGAAALRAGSDRFEWTHKRLDSGETFLSDVLLTAMEFDGNRVLQAVVRDITAQRQAMDALQQSEARYRSVVDSVHVGVAVISPEMRVLSLNRHMRERLPAVRVSDAPLCYQAFSDPPRQQPCPNCPTAQTLLDGESHVALMETPAGDRMLHIRIGSSPILDSTGRIVAIVETAADVTEQMRDERARERRQQHLESLQRVSRQLAGMTSLQEVLRSVVESARELVAGEVAVVGLVEGGVLTQVLHSGFEGAHVPTDAEVRDIAIFGQLLQGEEIFSNGVTRHHGSTQSPAWHPDITSCIGVPIRLEERVCAVLVVGTGSPETVYDGDDLSVIRALADLTGVAIHTSRLFEELLESNSFQQVLLDTAATAVMTVSTDRTVTSINGAFTGTTGYTWADIVGKSCLTLEGTPCDGGCGLFCAPHLERVVGKECSIKTKGGDTRVIRKNAQVLRDGHGELTGAVESFQDITDLVRVREDALAASQAKSAFLARMSHEIRTPMNGVIGMLALAMDTALTDEQQDYLATAAASADTLLVLINDILDFSKIEAGQLRVERRAFDVGAVVEEAVSVVAAEANRKGLELAAYVQPAVPAVVDGDGHRLRQVLVNLLGNAVKFTEAGEIVARVEVEHAAGNQCQMRFSVCDTGLGIADEAMSRIFEVFEQADGSTTRRYGGSGLGLAISRQLVELMGGTMQVRSKLGEGSTFSFELPLTLSRVQALPARASAEMLRGMRVLVVDDNVTNLRIVSEYVRSWGCVPTTADSALEGLDKLRAAASTNPFRLALLDAQMPAMSGFDLTRLIANDASLRSTTVLVLSSLGPGAADEAISAGAASYVVKPVRRSGLLDAIMTALGADETVECREGRTVPEALAVGLRVLVAEDNPVNQKVASRVLEKAGHTVCLVDDGRAAVEAVQQEPFDIVLMDVEMPQMDGLEAARLIRQLPEVGNLPIIALTAHAMEGDRERCLEAGMDDYLPKPFTADQLLYALAKWGRPCEAREPSQSPAEVPDMPPIDVAELLATLGGDAAFAATLVGELIGHAGKMLDGINAATEAGDSTQAGALAHSIRGGAAALGAEDLRQAAEVVERLGKGGDIPGVVEWAERIACEVSRLRRWQEEEPMVAG